MSYPNRIHAPLLPIWSQSVARRTKTNHVTKTQLIQIRKKEKRKENKKKREPVSQRSCCVSVSPTTRQLHKVFRIPSRTQQATQYLLDCAHAHACVRVRACVILSV
mmetsp:Transcript_1454/g.3014  ORF Transcript_1454/g.3014 Transcript_1454/m.3014 type:complete len:106 (+) Transcript_1454:431-748(+)